MRVLAGFLLAVALAAGCASASEEPGEPQPGEPRPGSALALEVESVASGPLHALYEDGRLFTPAPQPAIYPGPALPAFNVAQLAPARVADLVDTVLGSGLLDGSPSPAGDNDFLVTVREDEELRSVRLGPGRSQALMRHLADLPVSGADRLYEPQALAVVVVAPEPPVEGIEPETRDWPLGELPPGCSLVRGEDLAATLTAAGRANQLTRWRTPAGDLVGLTFRPLLPHETGCDDLAELQT